MKLEAKNRSRRLRKKLRVDEFKELGFDIAWKFKEDITDEEIARYNELKIYLDNIGFYDITSDSRYNQFLKLTSERKEFAFRTFTKEEKEELDRIAKEVLDEINNGKNL